MTNKTRKRVSVFILPAVMLLSACATPATVTPENALQERAEARWEALLGRDYASAYAFYSPGYRSTVSVTDFEIEIRLRRVRWTSAEYVNHECAESTCTVSFNVGYRVNRPVPGVEDWSGFSVVEDQWIKTGGEWWFLPEK